MGRAENGKHVSLPLRQSISETGFSVEVDVLTCPDYYGWLLSNPSGRANRGGGEETTVSL